jgi:hypothetical protein
LTGREAFPINGRLVEAMTPKLRGKKLRRLPPTIVRDISKHYTRKAM